MRLPDGLASRGNLTEGESPMATLVEIVPYDPAWPTFFANAQAVLRAWLGSAVVAVDHIGSTSVPGMPAKPVIDIDITLTGPDAIPGAAARLVEAGYEPRGNRYGDDVWAFLSKSAMPRLRVYLCPPHNRTHEQRLLFRDYLRRHDAAAMAYATLKRRLAERFPYDGDRYTAEKSAFVQGIVAKAVS